MNEHDPGDEDRSRNDEACPFCASRLSYVRGHITPMFRWEDPFDRIKPDFDAFEAADLGNDKIECEYLNTCVAKECIAQAQRFAREQRRSRYEKEKRAYHVNYLRRHDAPIDVLRSFLEQRP